MFRLCIVGCGITGALTAMLLKQRIPQLKVIILEKARGTGGRMSTSRSPFGSSVDLGAQFITQTSALSEIQKKCYSELLEAGLLHSLQENIEGLKSTPLATDHFVCPQGSGAVVKHFLQSAGCEVLFGHRVIKISPAGEKWKMTCDNNSDFEFDAVILTLPVPQVLQLEGIHSLVEDSVIEKLKEVKYCSRFALGLFYERESLFFENIPWTAKFINDSALRFCSIDHRKRRVSLSLPTLVVHSTKEFGKTHINGNDMSAVQKLLLEKLEDILPNVPKPSQIKFHKWRYSQVEKNYEGRKLGCLVASTTPLLICGGDGFSCSTFEGCIHSAENIAKTVVENYAKYISE